VHHPAGQVRMSIQAHEARGRKRDAVDRATKTSGDSRVCRPAAHNVVIEARKR
jgi:hypothetical protein